MISLLKQIAYEIDILKIPFSLYIDGKSKNSTLFGSFFSILIFFILYISFSQSNMIQKTNPYISEKVIKYPTSSNIAFKNDIWFLITLVDFYREGYIDKSIFTFDARIIIQNGSNITSQKSLNLRQCTNKDLEKKNVKEFSPSKFFCLDDEFSIFGNLEENYLSSLDISLRLCNSEIDGIKCKDENEINNFFKDKFLTLVYSEYSLNMENYENPYQITNSFRLNPINVKNKDFFLINFKKFLFSNDENWILNDEKQKKEELFMYDSENNINTNIVNFMSHNTISNPLAMYRIFSSKEVKIYSRKYQKLQEVLANVSGLANSLIFLGFIIIKLITHLKLISIINNSLFNVYPESKEVQKTLQKSNLNLKKKEKNFTIEINGNENNKIIKNNEMKLIKQKNENNKINNKESFLDIFPYFFEYFIVLKKINKPFCKIFQYIKMKLKNLIGKKLNSEENNILEAENFYKEKVDIIFILNKLQELEYLKQIVLTPTESSLFFLLINKSILFSNNLPEKQMYFNYLENYKSLLNKESKSPINIKFLELLNKNIEDYENLIKTV